MTLHKRLAKGSADTLTAHRVYMFGGWRNYLKTYCPTVLKDIKAQIKE